jgi:hypothetical protein
VSDYHTYEELRQLGEQVRDRAIQVSVEYESAQVVKAIHAEHAYDPLVDATGHVAADPTITQDTIRSYAQEAYAGVPQFFTVFATPDPAGMQPTIDTLMRTAYALAPTAVTDSLLAANQGKQAVDLSLPLPPGAWHPATSVETRVDDIIARGIVDWKGDGADAFERDYLRPLETAVLPQSELAVALAYALRAHKETRERMHNNIWDIGQKTLTALDSLHACNPREASTALTVFLAAVSVLLAIPTGGWSVRAAVGLGNAVQGFGGTVGGSTDAPVKDIGGATVNAVVSSMADAIASLTTGVDQQEQTISYFLGEVGGAFTVDDVTAPQPKAATKAAHEDINALRRDFYPR